MLLQLTIENSICEAALPPVFVDDHVSGFGCTFRTPLAARVCFCRNKTDAEGVEARAVALEHSLFIGFCRSCQKPPVTFHGLMLTGAIDAVYCTME